MTTRKTSRTHDLKNEIKRLDKELASTRDVFEAITTGKVDVILGPSCPFIVKAKQAEEAAEKLLQEKDVLIKEIHHR